MPPGDIRRADGTAAERQSHNAAIRQEFSRQAASFEDPAYMSIREIVPPDTALAFAAMQALRQELSDEATFVRRVDEVQRPEGYRLVGVFEQGVPHAVAVAGFRIAHSISWSRFLYVDDLSTRPEARRRGHGRRLLDWLASEGDRLSCEQLHLDSGVGFDRVAAHRLYFNAGLVISSYHFARRLEPRAGAPGR
jgi:GNAT superfamily N-acetyltransferase